MVKLTPQQRVFLIQRYYSRGDNPLRYVLDQFEAAFVVRPSETALNNLIHKFETEYTLEDRKRTRSHPATNEANQELVLASVAANPNVSVRDVAREVGVSPRSVSRVLHQNQFHPYKVQILHKLNDGDQDRRMQFCDEMIARIDANPNFVRNICFSDEATFFVNGEVNRHNMRYWSQDNPHWIDPIRAQGMPKVSI
jgi:hypothetical protein